jgi:uncharacterized membrane protein
MRSLLTDGLLWFSAIGCGLLAGVYFAFSAFIMTALARIDQASGIQAMNAINAVIVRSPFMPLFVGTTLTGAAAMVMAVLGWNERGSAAMLAAGFLHVFGMFVVTMAFNVPLNDALAAANAFSPEAASLWERYLRDWTFWNHVRTAASLGACGLFIAAIALR